MGARVGTGRDAVRAAASMTVATAMSTGIGSMAEAAAAAASNSLSVATAMALVCGGVCCWPALAPSRRSRARRPVGRQYQGRVCWNCPPRGSGVAAPSAMADRCR